MRLRKKLLTLGTASLAAVVLALAVFSSRSWAVETWHIWRLGSNDTTARDAAFGSLVDMKSLRAFPHLLEIGKSRKVHLLSFG